mmetsp:Transcript_23483/g.34143  ORF Transcript_23483/g.34143 Transcript_23483/m.34143 type:complete len:112 (-) Transcript_23483:1532-1867(-)
MDFKVGQEVYSVPDQFSFFDSDYKPPGQIASSGLTSPEAQLLSMSWLTGLINGIMKLSEEGMIGGNRFYTFGKGGILERGYVVYAQFPRVCSFVLSELLPYLSSRRCLSVI